MAEALKLFENIEPSTGTGNRKTFFSQKNAKNIYFFCEFLLFFELFLDNFFPENLCGSMLK